MKGKMVQIDPPGTWCLNAAFFKFLKEIQPRSFIEVGPGEGHLSARLCSNNIKGYGIDFSPDIGEILSSNMKKYIDQGIYTIIESDIMRDNIKIKADLVFSMLVMEHIQDDLLFIEQLKKLTKSNGYIIIAVPGRVDKWGVEDEIYGHYRRYDRNDLQRLMEKASIKDLQLYSLGVPVSNILFNVGNRFTRNSLLGKMNELDIAEKTKNSGLKNVPYKTLFPAWVKLLLNKYTMYPIVNIQRLFFLSNLGLTLICCGRVSD